MIFLFIEEGSIHDFTFFFQRDEVFYNKMPVRAHNHEWTQVDKEDSWYWLSDMWESLDKSQATPQVPPGQAPQASHWAESWGTDRNDA